MYFLLAERNIARAMVTIDVNGVEKGIFLLSWCKDFLGSSDSKKILLQCGRHGFDPWVRKIPWRRKCQSIPVFLPGKSHRQRHLVGHSPWGQKESEMTESLLSILSE